MSRVYECNLAGVKSITWNTHIFDTLKLSSNSIMYLSHQPFVNPDRSLSHTDDPNAVAVSIEMKDEDTEQDDYFLIGYIPRGKGQEYAHAAMQKQGEKHIFSSIRARVVKCAYGQDMGDNKIEWTEGNLDPFNHEKPDGVVTSITIQFDIPDDEPKIYTRVSTFVKAIDSSFGADHLIKWAFNQAETYGDYRRKLSELAEEGTEYHNAIEDCLHNGETKKDLPSGWSHFFNRFDPKVMSTEVRFYDDTLQVSGQYDALLQIEDEVILCDWKRAKQPSLSMMLQVSIYAHNLLAKHPNLKEAWIVCFGSSNKCGYSIKRLDMETIINYYDAMVKLNGVMNTLNIKRPRGEKCIIKA